MLSTALKYSCFSIPHNRRFFISLTTRSLSFSSSSSSSSSSLSPSPQQHRYWSGLELWRTSPVNESRKWGPTGPQPPEEITDSGPGACALAVVESANSLAEMGSLVLSTADPLEKSVISHLAYSRWRREKNLPVGAFDPPARPARPSKPQLVPTKEMPALKESGLPLNAYMLHNLAHVELNAIDLAWDTVVRFSPHREILGEGFFEDFAHVADDESRHFSWCSQRLAELGFRYGDMPAHNLLWRECEKSSDNVAARLASIPLVQEARGLDAGTRLVNKLTGFGDRRTSGIVARIADEEVAHVAVGVYWFVAVCEKSGRLPCTAFRELLNEYGVEVKGPFNHSAREAAGLPRDWYDASCGESQQEQLCEVHERLSYIISMESANASSDSSGV